MTLATATAERPARGAAVRLEPLGRVIETLPDEPLMRAARRAGLRWPTICNGAALCGTCYCRVVSHSDPLPPASPKESAALLAVPPHMQGPATRLACQLIPSGDVIVERAGVMPADPDPRQANPKPNPKLKQGTAHD